MDFIRVDVNLKRNLEKKIEISETSFFYPLATLLDPEHYLSLKFIGYFEN